VDAVIYKDLRGFIKQVDELGVLRRVHGADPKFELADHRGRGRDARVSSAAVRPHQGPRTGLSRLHQCDHHATARALALGIDPSLKPLDALKA